MGLIDTVLEKLNLKESDEDKGLITVRSKVNQKIAAEADSKTGIPNFVQAFKNYFKPTMNGRIRVRDYLRETVTDLPSELKRGGDVVGGKVLKFGRDVFQETSRSIASVALDAHNIANKPFGFEPINEVSAPGAEPGDNFADALKFTFFGDRPLESLSTRVERSPARLKEFLGDVGYNGMTEEQLKKFAIPGVFLLTAADFIPGGKGGKDFLKVLSKTDEVADVINLLRRGLAGGEHLGNDIIEPMADAIAASKSSDEVSKIINSFAETAGASRATEAVKAVDSIQNPTRPRNLYDLGDQKILSESEAGFIKTVRESPNASPEVAKAIAQNYNPITNKATFESAENLIRTNINAATKLAKDVKAPATTQSNAVAQLLITRAQNAGNFEEAIDIVNITAKRATSSGQAIQTLSAFNRLSPEGVLRYAQRVIDTSKSKVKLTDDIAESLVRQAKKIETMVDGEAKAIETAKLVAEIAAIPPSTIGQKLSMIQTLGQLLNPKTLIRNMVGNASFNVLENVSDVFGAALDTPLSFLTGKRSKVMPSILAQTRGFKTGWVDGIRDASLGIDTAGLGSKFDLPRTPIFKNKVGKAAEKLLNLSLRVPDRAAYKAAYDGSIYNQMKAAAKSGNKVLEPTDAMLEIAHHDGLYRTFQDSNALTFAFTKLKEALNFGKNFGLGDILIKYPRTPANLLARGIEYSPAGFANFIYQASRGLVGKAKWTQKDFVESFTRAIVGSGGLFGMGILLHRLGIITAADGTNKNINDVNRMTGLGEYRVNTSALLRFAMSGMDVESAALQEGDVLYSYDWLQPAAIPISMGANIDEGDASPASIVVNLIESVASGVDTLGEQPLISNLTRVLKFGDASDILIESAKEFPRSFTPTILNQINQLVDNTSRNTYDPNFFNETYNKAIQRIPGLSQTLPPRINTFGEDKEIYKDSSNNLFNVFFNPSFRSVYTPTPEAELVLDLFEITGETGQAPKVSAKSQVINGERVKIGPKTITQLQQFTGTMARDYFHMLANSSEFQAMGAEQQVKHMSNVLSDLGSAAKIVILGNRPKQNPSARTLQFIAQYMNGYMTSINQQESQR